MSTQQIMGWLPFIFVIIVFYIIILVPEGRRKKKYNSMISGLKMNDEILTKGGILGKIVNIQDNFIIIQSGPDRIRIKIDKSGVSTVTSSEQKEETKPSKEE